LPFVTIFANAKMRANGKRRLAGERYLTFSNGILF